MMLLLMCLRPHCGAIIGIYKILNTSLHHHTTMSRLKMTFWRVFVALTIKLLILGGVMSDQTAEIVTVQWKTIEDFSFGNLPQNLAKSILSSRQDALSAYKLKQVPGPSATVLTSLIGSSTEIRQIEQSTLEKEIVNEFSLETLRSLQNSKVFSSCGATIKDGHVKLINCPGEMSVMTLSSIKRVSCRGLEAMKFFGPIIIKNEKCYQQLSNFPNCSISAGLGFHKHNCYEVHFNESNRHLIIVLLVVSIMISLASISSIMFFYKLRQQRTKCNVSFESGSLLKEHYVSYCVEEGRTIITKSEPDVPNVEKITKTYSLTRVLLACLCFVPLNCKAYDLNDVLGDSLGTYKYSILMDSDEQVNVGSQYFGFPSSTTLARLNYQFTTYNWVVNHRNDYSCLQSGCNDIMVCRDDVLPFREANNKTKSYLKLEDKRRVFATCKNMYNYCTFGHGCFVIGFSLDYVDGSETKVYSIGRQTISNKDFVVPTGCFTDSVNREDDSSLEGLFYLESKTGDSWFCHSSLYSHNPQPNMLGDLKSDGSDTINFISENIRCATDRYRDVYCITPNSFVSRINKYCIPNTVESINHKVVRDGDTLIWKSRSTVSVKFTCDRNLHLTFSTDHCTNLSVDVWDLQNERSDLLLTMSAISPSGKGIFKIPSSVHTSMSAIECNGKPHNLILFDLKSLNSSGIRYNYHTNKKGLVPDNMIESDVAPLDGVTPFSWNWSGWLPSLGGWFAGGFSLLIVVGILILFLILRR